MTRDGRDGRDLLDEVKRLDITIEDLTPKEGFRVAVGIADDRTWAKHSRDALIAGHVRHRDFLMTTDPDDFLELGIPPTHLIILAEKTRTKRSRDR